MFKHDKYCLKGEVWKPIPFYEDIYEASNMGRIRTVDGKTTTSIRHGVRHWKGRILKNKEIKPNKKTGYRVTLWKDKKAKDWLVARLIAMAFYGIPNNFEHPSAKKRVTVNHKDGNRMNNHVNNLEWCSLKENIQHAFENNLIKIPKVVLINKKTNEAKKFNSMAKASIYLERNTNYISVCLSKGRKATSKEGTEYEIMKVISND